MGGLARLIRAVAGDRAASEILATLHIDRVLLADGAAESADRCEIGRATFAMALNALLFDDLLARVPTAAAYVADRRRLHQHITFDHGALRTIRFAAGPTGALPPGALPSPGSWSRWVMPWRETIRSTRCA